MPATTSCPACQGENEPGAAYCVHCGNATATRSGPLVREASRRSEGLVEALRIAAAGEYDVFGELGRGGMATVFLAHDIMLDRDVAIKVMSPALLYGEGMAERFKREARTAAHLVHPHIIPIYRVKETDDLLFFVMQYVAGRSLESIIEEMHQLPVRMVQTIVSQVGSALAYAHRKGVVHRDIKPANIMLDEGGNAVVTDFGIAKVSEAKGLTMTGSVVGTPFYMSPEQCSGMPVAGASDQYSLGVVSYQMLTGCLPFQAGTVMEAMRAHFFETPRPVEELRPDCPKDLSRAVLRMLEKEAGSRWPTLDDAVKAIAAPVLDHNDPVRTQMIELARSGSRLRELARTSVPVSPIPVIRPRPRPPEAVRAKRALRWIAAGLGAIAFGFGGSILLGRALVPPDPTMLPASVPRIAVDSGPSSTPVAADRAATPKPDTASMVPSGGNGAAQSGSPSRPSQALSRTRRASPPASAAIHSQERAIVPPSQPDPVQRDTDGAASYPAAAGAATIRENVLSPPSSDTVRRLPAPTTGWIKGWSSTPGAVLYLNGEAQGIATGPRVWPAPPGENTVELKAAGCETYRHAIKVTAGDTAVLGRRALVCQAPADSGP